MIYHFAKGSYKVAGGLGNGSRQDPWYWYGKTDNHRIAVNNSNTSSDDNCRLYFRVYLKSGVKYVIGQTAPGGGDGKIWLYDQSFNQITYNDDDEGSVGGEYCTDRFEYTPSQDGVYIIGAGAYSSSQGDYTVAISPLPEQEELPAIQKIYDTSTGFNGFGRAIGYRSASVAGCASAAIPTEGLVFYAPCETNTQVIVGNQFTTDGSFEAKTVQNIPCLQFSQSYRQPIDTSVFVRNRITLSAWYYSLDSQHNAILGVGQDSVYKTFCLQESYSQFTIERASGRFETGYIMEQNRWYHLAATLNDSTIKAYVNGKEVATFNQSMDVFEGKIGLGGWIDGGYSPDGYVTACRMYNRALTAQEIQKLSGEFTI